MFQFCFIIANFCQGRRNEKRAGGADFVEGHRQNCNYVKIHTLEFRGSVAFFLRQILTDHILRIASAITLEYQRDLSNMTRRQRRSENGVEMASYIHI